MSGGKGVGQRRKGPTCVQMHASNDAVVGSSGSVSSESQWARAGSWAKPQGKAAAAAELSAGQAQHP